MPGILTGPGRQGSNDQQELAQFSNDVADATGIDPRVVYAWGTIETGGHPYGGFHNWLNLRPYPGDPYSGVSPGNFEEYQNIKNAEAAAIRRLRQPFASGILASAHTTPEQEISAIAASGWDAGHYGGPGGPSFLNEFRALYPGVNISDPALKTGSKVSGQLAGGQTPGTLASGVTGVAGEVGGFLEKWVVRGALIVVGTGLALIGLYFIARAMGASPVTPLERVGNVVTRGRVAKRESTAKENASVAREARRYETNTARKQETERKRAERAKQRELDAYGDVPF